MINQPPESRFAASLTLFFDTIGALLAYGRAWYGQM
jgi:hypothetical protein